MNDCKNEMVDGIKHEKRTNEDLNGLEYLLASNISSEESPISSVGWYWDSSGVILNGKCFYDVAESYREQCGYAVILGYKIFYWLYDTYSYHNGDKHLIFNKYIPAWIEHMGFTIDFDNITEYSPNDGLASSVKELMKQRNCDVSVSLFADKIDALVYVNNYDASDNSYHTTAYPLCY